MAIALLDAASRLLTSQFGFTRTQVTAPAQPYHPQSQYSRLARPGRGRDYWQRIIDEGTDDGARNDTCAALAGYLIAIGQSEGYALDELRKWNSRCHPPLPDRVVARTLQSISRLDRRRHEDRRRDHR